MFIKEIYLLKGSLLKYKYNKKKLLAIQSYTNVKHIKN